MMQQDDRLESFIRQNRAAFEDDGPPPGLWAALEKEIPQQPTTNVVKMFTKHWLKVAVVVLLVLNGVLLTFFFQHKTKKEESINAVALIPELQEAQNYYTSQIEDKLQQIKAIPADKIGLDSTARRELELKNDTYKLLEKELANNPGNERIRAALIRYYQLKLELLDRILEEQERFDSLEKQEPYVKTL
ncbi:hypothetical protein LX64_03478 [Chitinophaga skermanii]|uniref:Anti-sigma factor n=1 Tax=Chitinophaga skermanii TaxID=331697 RepID=A0A327QDA7_9BACT|nr:hypothetical protein [Chitinophaga skermanii]RAJ02460.1 hypothetical protein LX64_03478 [Chitinophaga skermanii]